MVRIQGLSMHPYNTTLMGVLRGVADYYGLDMTAAWLFGGSGHAFLINIHDQLCPSGPYCWNYETFVSLLNNLGISMRDLGFFSTDSPLGDRKGVEDVIRGTLDAGIPCSMLNMENQLISGYLDDHFLLERPWPKADLSITPGTLAFQTWRELGEEVHVNFYAHYKVEKAPDAKVIRDSLSWALDMYQNPVRHTGKCYHIGLNAYDAWIRAVGSGFGSSHGNWWNGTVWSECRQMASAFFAEVAGKVREDERTRARGLSARYDRLSKLLGKASDKELPDGEKIDLLRKARESEKSGAQEIGELLKAL